MYNPPFSRNIGLNKGTFLRTNFFNLSLGNNPFLRKNDPKDNLYAEWNVLMKEWTEIEKENGLLDICCAIDSLYK
jgi:hypothetical protein